MSYSTLRFSLLPLIECDYSSPGWLRNRGYALCLECLDSEHMITDGIG